MKNNIEVPINQISSNGYIWSQIKIKSHSLLEVKFYWKLFSNKDFFNMKHD